MATEVTVKKPTQQGVEDSLLEYYDIMVIGKTGMGKSTTVDKMIIAKLEDAREERSSAIQQAEPVYNKLECDDLSMWLVSEKPSDPEPDYHDDNFEMMSLRLKSLVFFRSVENSHIEVNNSRDTNMSIYKSTLECELLSNECTRVRVLDVPGFFGREASSDTEAPEERMKKSAESALGNMRKVLRIKNAHSMKFRRVVYFLPEQGALKRTSQSLIAELQVIEKYFGRAIFDSMVVIATVPSIMYEHVSPECIIFSDNHFKQTNQHLQEALKVTFKGKIVPEPPIEFLSLFDTCEEVLRKVQNAKVLKESIELEFRSSICARCGLTIYEEGEGGGESYCTSPNSLGAIPFDESTCHPVMIPKYSKVKKVLGGVLHLVTLRQFMGRWPSFASMDEVCIGCKQPPSSAGCMKIGEEYPGAKDGIVKHSSSAVETYRIEMEDKADEVVESTPSSQEDGGNIAVGVDASLPVSEAPIQQDLRHNHAGRYVYVQQESSPPNFEIKG